MNWIQRLVTRKARLDQNVTLELSPEDWNELQEWAKSYDWTPAKMITIWVQNRMHGTGRIGN